MLRKWPAEILSVFRRHVMPRQLHRQFPTILAAAPREARRYLAVSCGVLRIHMTRLTRTEGRGSGKSRMRSMTVERHDRP